MAAPPASRVAQLTAQPIDLRATMALPRAPAKAELRRFYFREIGDIFHGLVRAGEAGFFLGPLPLVTFEAPEELPDGWQWRIKDGLLARPGGDAGRLRITAGQGQAAVEVIAFRHWLPSDVYRVTQKPFHRFFTWLALRRLRRALGD